MASVVHYNFVKQQSVAEEAFEAEGNIEFLKGKWGSLNFGKIKDATVQEIKQYLIENGITCRYQPEETAHA
jgi:hypothetical protein